MGQGVLDSAEVFGLDVDVEEMVLHLHLPPFQTVLVCCLEDLLECPDGLLEFAITDQPLGVEEINL